jgi:hypothetical protein
MVLKQTLGAILFIACLTCSAQSSRAQTSTPIYNAPNWAATTRCPADESGCTIYNAPDRIQDRVNQGRKDVQDADSPLDKVKEVGKTLRDCLKCGTDAIKDGVSR